MNYKAFFFSFDSPIKKRLKIFVELDIERVYNSSL